LQNGKNAELQNSRTSSRYRKLLPRSVTRKSPVPVRVRWNKRGYPQMDPSLRREIVEYVNVSYTQEGIVSTVRDLLNFFESFTAHKLSRDAIYHAFPGGMREICREAGVPVPEERYRAAGVPVPEERYRAAGAKRKTAGRSSGRGIGSDAADLEKVVFAELRRGLQPVEVVEKYGNAEQVVRLAKIFRQAQRLSITQTRETSTPSRHTT
jgi:hypothetical protein